MPLRRGTSSAAREAIETQAYRDVPLILYPNAPRPSYADQVLSFYRKLGLEPKVGFEVRELQTALGLVAADVGIALVPSSVRRLGRDDVEYLALDEPEITSPIIMSYPPQRYVATAGQDSQARPRVRAAAKDRHLTVISHCQGTIGVNGESSSGAASHRCSENVSCTPRVAAELVAPPKFSARCH